MLLKPMEADLGVIFYMVFEARISAHLQYVQGRFYHTNMADLTKCDTYEDGRANLVTMAIMV